VEVNINANINVTINKEPEGIDHLLEDATDEDWADIKSSGFTIDDVRQAIKEGKLKAPKSPPIPKDWDK